mmetsp:Transcript_9459/g.15219  ORF Transcript_9459/g.15219 Transcript_9459/m.15219 type:complete len:728 (+) Transcript_9459:19-2202(+)
MQPFVMLLALLFNFQLLTVLSAPVHLQENTEIEFAYTVGNNNFYYVYTDGSDQLYTFSQYATSITISTYIPIASPTPWHVTVRKGQPAWPSGNSFNVEHLLQNIGLNVKNQGWGGIFYKYGDGCLYHCDWSNIRKSHTIRISTPTLHPTGQPTSFTPSPTHFPSVSPTLYPTAPTHPTPLPTGNPSATPSRSPTRYPSRVPTLDPTPNPTPMPTARPTLHPTMPPTSSPSRHPTMNPSVSPTGNPSASPSHSPTQLPSISPTKHPTWNPSVHPTASPTANPSYFPTMSPSRSPTLSPTRNPSTSPTHQPSQHPTAFPTVFPTRTPTASPTRNPTTSPSRDPTQHPTAFPTVSPTRSPTVDPTRNPTASPTRDPTKPPSVNPTASPTKQPSLFPTVSPSRSPTRSPSRNPSASPTKAPSQPPSVSPTRNPTSSPTQDPTPNPSSSPTNFPSASPSVSPSAAPTYYVNPYCPETHAIEMMGPQTANLALTEYAECRTNDPALPGSRAIDYQGKLTCQSSFACCLCQQIYCGASGYGCSRLIMGVSAGIGVPNIYIQSTSSIARMTNPYDSANGASFYCNAPESCKNTNIEGGYISHGHCNGEYGCQNSRIVLEPADKMIFKCDGRFSCAGANIEITIGRDSPVANIESLTFLGEQSADSATVTIRNESPHALIIKNFECASTSCMNTVWRFEGLIFLQSCDLIGLQNLYQLPLVMQSCILGTPYSPQPI